MSETKLSPSTEALFQEIGSEAVILDLASSTYFGLEGVGVRIWQLLQQGKTPDELTAQLLTEYEVEEPQLRRDIDVFVQALLAAGLLSESHA